MELKLTVDVSDNQTRIELPEKQGTIQIITGEKLMVSQSRLNLLIKGHQIVGLSVPPVTSYVADETVEKIITIEPAWEIELVYLKQSFVNEATKNGLDLNQQPSETIVLPQPSQKLISDYQAMLLKILELFGYQLRPQAISQPVKNKPAKAQHRWSKAVSQIEFKVDTRGGQATVVWQKRQEMLVKAGAKMLEVVPLNKDGSVGFSAKMGQKIRSDYAASFTDFVTTEDLILKSVNEVGLFLYFGGTNSWLELKDSDGKTIDQWTVV